MSIILMVVSVCLLAAAVVLAVKLSGASADRRALLDDKRELGQRVADLDGERARLMEGKSLLEAEKIRLEATLAAQDEARRALDDERRHAAEEQRLRREEDLRNMREAFKALSAENSEAFRKVSAQSVGELLKPMQEKFEKFSESVKASDEKSAERSGSMEKMIRMLSEQSRSVGDQARALADAITGQSKAQGDFGEMLLVDLLRESGLQEGVNFDVQAVIRDDQGHEIFNDEGGRMIPDVIVHYPDGGEVIVDSKVSLKAFVAWSQAGTAEERKRLAREHLDSIRSHIGELRGKDYASYIPEGRKKIDYNLMFIPVENAFRLMQETEPLLWQQAKNQGVLIVSQMSLAIVLNMVLVAWRQFDQQRNIQEVFKTASELMSTLENWMKEYVKVGEKLESLSSSYRESTRLLTESSQSVVKKIGKLERLGATRKRSNAAVKGTGRMVGGRESVIPAALASGLDDDNADNQNNSI